jgi:hypothetical protein
MKKFILIMTLLVGNSFAGKLDKFSHDLEDRLILDLNHLSFVESRIKIRRPNAFERWFMNRNGAEATYNDKTNVIVLRQKNFHNGRIISRSDMPANQQYSFIVMASTVFHEMAHADFDTVLERSNLPIRRTIDSMLRWFKRNTRFNAKIAAHEFFGYSAGDILLGLDNEVSDILLQHRIHPQTLRCFGTSVEHNEFKLRSEKNYVTSFTPRDIFIKGKSLDLDKVKFPAKYREEVYSYFAQRYNFPKNRSELIQIMNRSKYIDILSSCKN